MGKALENVLLIILVITLVYFSLGLFQRNREDRKLKQIAEEVEDTTDQENTEGQTGEGNLRISTKYPNLYATLEIPGTLINYPVAYIPGDSSYYLHHDLEGNETISGTPFLAGECFTGCGNLIIYGHHMSDGSVFTGLLGYDNPDFCRDHSVIHLTDCSSNSCSTYQVVACFYSKIGDLDFEYYNYYDLRDPQRKSEFIDKINRHKLYQTATPINTGDEFLTLSTCSYHVKDGRFVVVATKIN